MLKRTLKGIWWAVLAVGLIYFAAWSDSLTVVRTRLYWWITHIVAVLGALWAFGFGYYSIPPGK